MSAMCRCWCGCERIDRQLSDETSSELSCRACLVDRHLTQHPTLTERLIDVEFAVRRLQERLGIPTSERLGKL